MNEQEPAPEPAGKPRVVKKVVKRTVVRPSSSAARTSRPVGAAGASVQSRPRSAPASEQVPRRASIDLGTVRETGRRWSKRGGRGASAGVQGLRGAASGARAFMSDRYWDVRTFRLPEQPPLRAAAIVGLLLGLLAVVVGWLAGIVFFELRGTSAGGGAWGGLVVVALAVACTWLGARLLTVLGVEHGATVSTLAVLVVLVAVLAFFLDLAGGSWAWLVVPALTTAAYVVATVLTGLATRETEDSE